MSQPDAAETPTMPKPLGYRELGRIARSLDISPLGLEPKAVPGIDRAFEEADGNIARFAQKKGAAPLDAARELLGVDLIARSDRRFAHALDVSLEKRDTDFVEKMTKPESMLQSAKGFADKLKGTENRQGFLQMRAVCMAAEKGEKLTAGTMAIALEGAATGKISDDLRDEMLRSSARYGLASHLQREQSREKAAERSGVAR
jgi:hypothetical protein